jgi:uncharacterized membrane protein
MPTRDLAQGGREEGRPAAIAGWVLYLLSIPSLAIFAPIGAAVAYFSRGDAVGIVRSHLDAQLRLFLIAFIWGVALFLVSIPAWMLTIVLIGFPLLWAIAIAGFGVMIWFTVKSLLNLLRLFDGQPAR